MLQLSSFITREMAQLGVSVQLIEHAALCNFVATGALYSLAAGMPVIVFQYGIWYFGAQYVIAWERGRVRKLYLKLLIKCRTHL